MQNTKTPLLYTLVCLSVTLPLLSGCRSTGGPFYKVSSYEFYNPFASKQKKYDDSALVGKIDDSYGHSLQKQEIATPPGGYLKDPAQENKVAVANNRSRTSTDSINELRNAEFARNSNTAGSVGIASTKPKPDSMLPPTGNMTATNQTQQPGTYGTTTPINPGFGAGNGQLTAQQSTAQQPLNPGTSYSTNPNTPPYGQPGFDPFGQQMVAGQTNPQNQVQNQAGFPGQQGNMTAATQGNSQYPYLNNADSMSSSNNNAAMPGANMVAMNQGTVYSGGQHFGLNNDAATFNNQFPVSYSAQPATPQGIGAIPQNAAMPNNSTMPGNPNAGYGQQPMAMSNGQMPNGQGTSDPGFGMSGFGNPVNSGMSNPSATGATAFPPYDPSQVTMQPAVAVSPGAQTYPGFSTTQQPANGGYQNGFNYFGPPADSNEYRPGSTTATYGGW